ncbi:Histidine--tRNA ligase [Pseudodesulfovibrio profundus]|uniref:Histidine--tRNA ligase n=1 Tax=Pseudodesulfovibrio profundus TaxID=57320 RepID=A0A2C8FAT0_9BACT|nr:histidine--tRNA ligase [Pseudodesulfovibrio profundus]MBC16123.1 histidine--tRNA ligase [Desulfovibrio sp.]SOB59256.1 Histidine--tRNA ligase [Pseudodesulfovibrio profundus]|tara:strand:- start:6064 stop:7305 length:1242 start_codon:yes stop_codon:yes gene_type:complete
MSKVQKIKGFVDLFPEEAAKFTAMETRAREVFSRYGFGELRTPILEKTELFQKSIGEDTDVVGKEMFTFPDRKDRSLTMRPEATAGVVRAFIESKTHQPGKISKFFTFGPMFRYERPQKGRQRQFHQLNAEIFGADEAQADAELILMLRTFLNKLGLTKLTIELNSLGCHECRPTYKQALIDYYKSKDKENFCEDCRRRMETNPLRVLDCKVPTCKELVVDAPVITDHLCDDCETHFGDVKAILDGADVNYELNPRLVRGLDYYVRTCFEVASYDIGSQTAVAGGGRYDGLIKNLGGPDCPGTGFACGMERLALLLEQLEAETPDFYLAVVDKEAANAAMLFAQQLRDKGLKGEVSYSGGSMKSRMRAANKTGAKVCLIMGGSELADGTVTIKDMVGDREQETLDREQYLASQ